MLGATQSTVSRWERGAKPEPDMLVAIAQQLGVSVEQLMNSDSLVSDVRAIGPTLYVKGTVAAGLWREAFEEHPDEWETFTGRADVSASNEHRFGLRVSGDSMDEIYPSGTIVECVSVFGHIEAHIGRRVIIIRKRLSDQCYEATVKELVDIEGVLWARPRSSNPAHQAFRLDQPQQDIEEVRIVAVVVSSIRPE